MNIAALFIRRPVTTTLVMLAILLFGVMSYRILPVSDLPVRKLSAIEALTRRGQQPLSAISSLEIEPIRLPTSALIDWYLIAKRLDKLPGRAEKMALPECDPDNLVVIFQSGAYGATVSPRGFLSHPDLVEILL